MCVCLVCVCVRLSTMFLLYTWAFMRVCVCICLRRIPGQPSLEDKYRNECYSVFLKTLQAPKPANCDELLYSTVGIVTLLSSCFQTSASLRFETYWIRCSVQVVQAALKGLQCCLSGGKWRFGGGEEVGSLLAMLKVCLLIGYAVCILIGCAVCILIGCAVCNLIGCAVCILIGYAVCNLIGCAVCILIGCAVCPEADVPGSTGGECGVAVCAVPCSSSSVRRSVHTQAS